MKPRDLLFYLAAGLALGAVAGAVAARALGVYDDSRWSAVILFAFAGAIAGSAGAVVSGSRRAAARDAAAGFVLSGGGLWVISLARFARGDLSTNAVAVGLVFFTFIFSAALGASHAWSLRERGAWVAAALFGGVGGLLALALGMKIISIANLVVTAAAAGAVYGGFVWTAIAAARRIFIVDVGQFRV